MDPEWLLEETEQWVDDGVITQEQAEEIRDRYPGGDEDRRADALPRSRVVTGLSLMGATLIGIGIVVYLGVNWENLPRWLQTAVVVGAPGGAFLAGRWLRTTIGYPRVGHGVVVLGVGLTGVSLFLLNDLYALELSPETLLTAWAAVALPVSHGLQSRITTVLGIGLVGATLFLLVEPGDPGLLFGFYGVVLFGIAVARAGVSDEITEVYRIVGAVTLIGALLAVALQDGRLSVVSLEPTTAILGTGAGATLLTGYAWWLVRRSVAVRWEAVWPSIALGAVLAVVVLTTLTPELPRMGVFFVVHGLVLATLVGTVATGYHLGSTGVVNVGSLGFLLQVLVFLQTTVIDALPTSLALVVAGLLLLVIGLGLERGRRSMLDRMQNRSA